ncbi:MAG: hypothetical protein F6K24_15635 [Okeania sp. SIO2D1]|nr:hypothetical protein [Okeania sp. SIO2D1]
MNEPSICLTSTTFLNKELKHKNNKLKLPTKGNKAEVRSSDHRRLADR